MKRWLRLGNVNMGYIVLARLSNAFLVTFFFLPHFPQASSPVPSKLSTSPQRSSGLEMNAFPFPENRIRLKRPLAKPSIIVLKSKRQLLLYSEGKLVRTYRVGLGVNPIDDKKKEGDRRTPEGIYYIFTKNERSAYYLSLGLSYPNAKDAERGLRDGLIDRTQYRQILNALRVKAAPPQNTALGGLIYIHGNGSRTDWTWGCIALDDANIRELFDVVSIGTEVIIEH